MSETKLCPNGHLYAASDAACPYCPRPNAPAPADATMAMSGGSNSQKTQIFNGPTAGPAPGEGSGSANKTQIFNGPAAQAQPPFGQPAPAAARKLVGWLVTYDSGNAMGRDYRLTEGRNTVGAARTNDVAADFDSRISSHHLTILFRLGAFSFRDELSTNGTFLNGAMANEGTLQDGDKLRIGDTTFLFRTALF